MVTSQTSEVNEGASVTPVDECPFCRGAQVAEIYRFSHWRSIYNRAPVVPGHSLLVPLRHVEHVRDLNTLEQAEFIPALAQLSAALMRRHSGTGFDVAIQEGESAGQSVAHLHVHCMPRKLGDLDEPGTWTRRLGVGARWEAPDRTELSMDAMREEAQRIRAEIM